MFNPGMAAAVKKAIEAGAQKGKEKAEEDLRRQSNSYEKPFSKKESVLSRLGKTIEKLNPLEHKRLKCLAEKKLEETNAVDSLRSALKQQLDRQEGLDLVKEDIFGEAWVFLLRKGGVFFDRDISPDIKKTEERLKIVDENIKNIKALNDMDLIIESINGGAYEANLALFYEEHKNEIEDMFGQVWQARPKNEYGQRVGNFDSQKERRRITEELMKKEKEESALQTQT